LFWKYAAFCSGLVGALLVLSGAAGGYFAFRQSTAALAELQRTKAQSAANEISRFIGRVQDALQSTTRKFNASGAIDAGGLLLELNGLLRHQPSIAELHWIAADGRDMLVLSRVVRDEVDSGRNWADDPRFQGARAQGRFVGPVIFRAETDANVSLAASRDPDGPVLVADVNRKFVGDVVGSLDGGPTTIAYVVDGEGRLLAHPDNSIAIGNAEFSALPQVRGLIGENLSQATVASEAHNLEGVTVVATAVPIERLGWTVVVEQPHLDPRERRTDRTGSRRGRDRGRGDDG